MIALLIALLIGYPCAACVRQRLEGMRAKECGA
jgi:hypothetical protein